MTTQPHEGPEREVTEGTEGTGGAEGLDAVGAGCCTLLMAGGIACLSVGAIAIRNGAGLGGLALAGVLVLIPVVTWFVHASSAGWPSNRARVLAVCAATLALGGVLTLYGQGVLHRASCGAWKVVVASEVREVLLGARAWREEHGVLPPSVGVLFFERWVDAPDFDHWCVHGWDAPVVVAGVSLNAWERGKVSDAEALSAAQAMAHPADGWERVGYHWYCLREEAWEDGIADSVVAFALSGPIMKPGCMIQMGFADGHVETIRTRDVERWAEVESALAALGLALPSGLVEYARGEGVER